MIGYAICGSFCTFSKSLSALSALVNWGLDIQPIMSENAYNTDTRFFRAEDFRNKVRELTQKEIIHTVKDAEPFGAAAPLEYLIIAPCTGNTLAKIAHGISDTSVTMAAKAHLRGDRPTLIALSSNDAMSQNLKNLSTLLQRKSVYFLPLLQDDPKSKPHSLVADLSRMGEGFEAMKRKEQLRPLFI